jgi:hypothetical protein
MKAGALQERQQPYQMVSVAGCLGYDVLVKLHHHTL